MPVDVTQFWSTLERQRLTIETAGIAETWTAPVAQFRAPNGFGEELWLTEIPQTVLAIQLSGTDVKKCAGKGSGLTSAGRGYAATLQPKGTRNEFQADGPCVFAHIALSDALIDGASERLGIAPMSGLLRSDVVFDPCPQLNGAALDYVRRALCARAPPTALEMEGRALFLLDRVLALHVRSRPSGPKRGGLAPRQLRRVTEFMGDHVGQELLLDDLAGLVGLSAKHFARAFRDSTGVPPHRWLTNQRIERARELLAAGDLPIAEIALICGFADQSHFTVTFKKATGLTPGAYRREMLG